MSFFEELKRRNVFRVGIAYVLLGWVVLQASDFALDLIDAPNWIIQAMFIIGLAGLPIALFFAWAFEITPEGIKREADVDRSASVTPQTGRKLDRAIIVFLAAAVVLLLVDRIQLTREADTDSATQQAVRSETVTADEASAPTPTEAATTDDGSTSIAVLPFLNMSSDPEQEFFSDGISEEILNALSKVEAMRVAGRSSSFAFKGENNDLRKIGQTLGVEHILEGSVRKAGDTVRITAQLVQAEDGFQLWSETYDRQLTDIFAIQDDIATRILVALTETLEVGDIAPTTMATPIDIAAYNKYLMGRQLMRERREAPLQQAAALFEEVTEAEPGFAPAWAELGITILLLSDDVSSYGSIPIQESIELAGRHLERARTLDPDGPEVLAGLGLLYDNSLQRDLAIDSLQRALAINPNMSDASNWLWRTYWQTGRIGDTVALGEDIRQRDPLYRPMATNIAFAYMAQGNEDALLALRDVVERQFANVDESVVREVEAAIALTRGDFAAAMATRRPTDDSEELWSWVRATFVLELGATELAARTAAGTPAEFLALAYEGRVEEANSLAAAKIANGQGIRAYIQALAANDQYEQLVQFFDQRWDSLEAFEQQVVAFGLETGEPIGRMVEALRATGDDARAERFLDRFGEVIAIAEREGANNHWHTFSKAHYATLRGDTESALTHFARLAEQGRPLAPDFTRHWKSFDLLRGNPEFESLLAQMVERFNTQRSALGLPAYEETLSG